MLTGVARVRRGGLLPSLCLAATLLSQPARAAAENSTKTHYMIEKSTFGTLPDGSVADVYTLTNRNGIVLQNHQLRRHHHGNWTRRTSRGIWRISCSATTTCRKYLERSPYFRRVGGTRRKPDCERKVHAGWPDMYTLAINNGPNHLHGGKRRIRQGPLAGGDEYEGRQFVAEADLHQRRW